MATEAINEPLSATVEVEPSSEVEFLAQVKVMQQRAALHPRPAPTAPDWLDRNFGLFANDPTWDDFMAHMRHQKQDDAVEENLPDFIGVDKSS